MKKLIKLLVVFVVLLFPFSCQEDLLQEEDNGAELRSASFLIEFPVKPEFGLPNSTKYFFKVYDLSGSPQLSVKLYEKASGKTTYLPMTKVGNYWTLSQKIKINGWYDYRYVYTKTKKSISSDNYVLCNTYNEFNSDDVSSLSWPFGADGSSWTKRSVKVNGKYQKWVSGIEDGKGKGGYGWNEGTHIDSKERYAVDWNRGTGSQDLGAELRSPLDGEVYATGTYNTDYGKSKYVSVIQEGSDGITYRFFFGHMETISIEEGEIVRAGITKLGTLGKTGTDSPHAHCSMRNHDTNESVKFQFDAK